MFSLKLSNQTGFLPLITIPHQPPATLPCHLTERHRTAAMGQRSAEERSLRLSRHFRLNFTGLSLTVTGLLNELDLLGCQAHNGYSMPGKGKRVTHLCESSHCLTPQFNRLCTWMFSFNTNNYNNHKPYRQKYCNSHPPLYNLKEQDLNLLDCKAKNQYQIRSDQSLSRV